MPSGEHHVVAAAAAARHPSLLGLVVFAVKRFHFQKVDVRGTGADRIAGFRPIGHEVSRLEIKFFQVKSVRGGKGAGTSGVFQVGFLIRISVEGEVQGQLGHSIIIRDLDFRKHFFNVADFSIPAGPGETDDGRLILQGFNQKFIGSRIPEALLILEVDPVVVIH